MGIFNEKPISKELNDPSNYIKCDNLTRAIENILQGNYNYVTEKEMGNEKVAEEWNKLINKLTQENISMVLNMNEMLGAISKMDSVKLMINSIDKQTESLNNMVKNSDNLNVSFK